ncbi:DNA primase/polymerase [Gordonia phage OtterstedtS21]|uniref:DNA primase/polymerase n=1 Tax=Gordonia phage OtterstedtS21 TaxID=2927260 RepID=A0A9E7U4Y6_9CAUD|nr:DNA primase/polymerase [Gordonia phage OtterstedtS21]
MAEPARDINSSRPFHRTAQAWLDKGHLPFPLKPKGKNPLEKDAYTGKKNPFPKDPEQFVEAQLAKAPQRANIGIWVGPDIICLDIDHYVKDEGTDKEKRYVGHDEYLKLAEELGPLPDTYITTARSDGKSGIHWYRMPEKYINRETLNNTINLSGKAASNIDVVHRGYRFAVVGPSIHPETDSPYRTYAPGVAPDGKSFEATDPFSTEDLPYLPEPWIKFLSKDYTEYSEVDMDMSMQSDKIIDWYRDRMPKGKPCSQVKKSLKYALKELSERADGHEVLTAADWNLLSLGSEGHPGALAGAKYFEKQYFESMVKRGKRSPSEVKREIFRSRTNAIRKIKAHVDKMEDEGIDVVGKSCTCVDLSEIVRAQSEELASIISLVPLDAGKAETKGGGTVRSPEDYSMDDDGNAEFLYDLTGHDNLKYVKGVNKFILWNGKRWKQDDELHSLTRIVYQKVKERQQTYANSLKDAVTEAASGLQEARNEQAKDGSVSSATEDYNTAKKKYNEWLRWAQRSGNVLHIKNALTAYQSTSFESTIDSGDLDANRMLLGVKNGVLELREDRVVFRQAKYSDFVTLNTGIEYFEGGIAEAARKGGDLAESAIMWENYLNKVLPDLELREFVQRAFGAALGGPGKERLMYFLYGPSTTGKSTMIRLIEEALGDYSMPINLNIFKNAKLNPALGEAMDRRVVVASEVSLETGMDEGIVKQITGNDPLSVEYKNSNHMKRGIFKATVAIATNVPPRIKGADDALYRRLCVMPFNERLTSENPNFVDDFVRKNGLTMVFHWMVDGYQAYTKKGLHRGTWPERVKLATLEFGHGMSDIGEFLEATVVEVPFNGETVETRSSTALECKSVYKAYESWCTKQKIPDGDRLTLNGFGRQMKAQGYRSHAVRMVKGNPPVKVYEGIQFVESYGSTPQFKDGS